MPQDQRKRRGWYLPTPEYRRAGRARRRCAGTDHIPLDRCLRDPKTIRYYSVRLALAYGFQDLIALRMAVYRALA